MNDETFLAVFERQYGAALSMLRNAIEKCPPTAWDDRTHEAAFWQQALHVIFYARLYLLESLNSSEAGDNSRGAMQIVGEPLQDFSESEQQRLGKTMWSLTQKSFTPKRVPTKQELFERIDRCREALERAVASLAKSGLDARGPMPWIPGTRADLLIYNLRHVAHHVGRLNGILGRHGVSNEWVGGL